MFTCASPPGRRPTARVGELVDVASRCRRCSSRCRRTGTPARRPAGTSRARRACAGPRGRPAGRWPARRRCTGWPIASTTGKAEHEQRRGRRERRGSRHRCRALSGQRGLLLFGPAAPPGVEEHRRRSSITSSAAPTASGAMNSQNGISSVAVWLFRLLRDRDDRGVGDSKPNTPTPASLDRELQQPARPAAAAAPGTPPSGSGRHRCVT